MVESWQEELRAKGYRVTPQRQLVLEAVTNLEHGTPEEICTEVQRTARGVNISTVYAAAGLADVLRRDFGFETDVHHLTVYGRCKECRAT